MQKLKAWAEGQGLLMEFEIESEGFKSEIKTITIRSGDQAVEDADAVLCGSAEEAPAPGADLGDTVLNADAACDGVEAECFDCDSLDCR